MKWIAHSQEDTDDTALGECVRDSTDQFPANSSLKSQEYTGSIFGLF